MFTTDTTKISVSGKVVSSISAIPMMRHSMIRYSCRGVSMISYNCATVVQDPRLGGLKPRGWVLTGSPSKELKLGVRWDDEKLAI